MLSRGWVLSWGWGGVGWGGGRGSVEKETSGTKWAGKQNFH